MPEKKRILTTGEVAEYCGVNFRTVIRWIEKGLLKGYKLPGRGDHRVSIDDLVQFLRQNDMPIPKEFKHDNPRALIVEDDLNLAKAMAIFLEKAGFNVKLANDGFKAGAVLHEFIPDVMVLDLNMPGMSGLEVLKFVRGSEKLSHVKVIVVSAMPRERLEEARKAGADDIVPKPFKSKELVDKVLTLLGMNQRKETDRK